ncbi:MAG: hypothetical protein HC853_17605 [Anaerolineae bacterium]|nr:hypothetical protein [Anaerolineae bacterium]
MTISNNEATHFSAQAAAHSRSTSEILSQTFQIFSKNFTHFAGLSLLVMAPLAVLGLLLTQLRADPDWFEESFTDATSTTSSVRAFSQMTNSLVSSCVGLLALIVGAFFPWMEGALTYSLFERVLGREPSVRDAYRATQSRWGSLWGSNFLARLGLNAPLILVSCIGGFALAIMLAAITNGAVSGDSNLGLALGLGSVCLVPLIAGYLIYALVMGVNWRFRAPVIVAEGADTTRSLGRSIELAKGMRGSLLGRMLVFWIIEAVFVGGPALAAYGLREASYVISEGGGLAYAASILFLVIAGVTQIVITPLHIIYVALLYLDVRVRKENLLLQPTRPTPIEPVLIPAAITMPTATVVTPAAPISPVLPAPGIPMPSIAPSPALAPSAQTPVDPLSTPAQKIGALFNRMRTEGPSADLLNDLGMAYMDVGDLGGALDAFTRARDLAPNDADIAYNLVLLHRARKDTGSARNMMQEYLRLETNPADVERVRGDARFSDLI